jgi:Asp-tRNA(Asn)/Glu-tRNA(Gln) amidotransferase A subunit family amidase
MLKRIWDGLSQSRRDQSLDRAPDQYDWLALVAEVQKTQEHLLTITGAEVPEVAAQLEAADKQLAKIGERLEALQVPADMRAEVTALTARMDKQEARMAKVDARSQQVQHEANVLKSRVDKRLDAMDSALMKMQAALSTSQSRFGEEVRTEIKNIRETVTDFASTLEWAV